MSYADTVTATRQRPDLPTSTTVLRLDGDLSLAATSALRLRLASALRSATKRLVLDLSSVQPCDPGLERYLMVCPDLPGALVTRLTRAGAGSREGTA